MSKSIVLSLAAALLAVGSAQGTALAPGACVGASPSPPPCTGSISLFPNTGITLLDQQTQAVASGSGPGTYTGTMMSAVYQEPTGTLDFLYQFQNDATSTDDVQQIVVSSFTGFQTDVNITASLLCIPGQGCSLLGPFIPGAPIGPLNASRSLSGDTISFQDFGRTSVQPPVNIKGGHMSSVLLIRTDATAYGAGLVTTVGSASTQSSSFAPAAVPEPGVLSLTMLGVLAGAFAGRRKLSKRSQFQS